MLCIEVTKCQIKEVLPLYKDTELYGNLQIGYDSSL